MTLPLDPAFHNPKIAVIIPCHGVGDAIFHVLERIGPEVTRIFVVDDLCPDRTADRVEARCDDPRIRVIRHLVNKGVGGALISGYRAVLEEGLDIAVKIDGDGQMPPELISRFVGPILNGTADYTKGNRFYRVEDLQDMPPLRLFGNAVLSFLTKLSSGYWSIFDPTNGYTAIHRAVLAELPLDKIANDYFFESDMLFRLNTVRAVVRDIPMRAVYGDERSGLRIARIVPRFLKLHYINFLKRIFYNYLLRDFQLASMALLTGLPMLVFGFLFGVSAWLDSVGTGIPASAGTVMLSSLPVLMGVQLLLLALTYDIQTQPSTPIHPDLDQSGADHDAERVLSDPVLDEV